MKNWSKKVLFAGGAYFSTTTFLPLKSCPPILPFVLTGWTGSSLAFGNVENEFQLNPLYGLTGKDFSATTAFPFTDVSIALEVSTAFLLPKLNTDYFFGSGTGSGFASTFLTPPKLNPDYFLG